MGLGGVGGEVHQQCRSHSRLHFLQILIIPQDNHHPLAAEETKAQRG